MNSSVTRSVFSWPILERSCWNCHGAATQTSDLDLRTRETAIAGGRRGTAIVPGHAEDSRFYRYVAGLDEPMMPMEGDPLSEPEIEAVREWINDGAHWESRIPGQCGLFCAHPSVPAPPQD